MSGVDKSRRRGSVLSVLHRRDKARGKADTAARQSLDDHERAGLHSILPDLGDQSTLKRRPAGIDLRQLARDEAAAKLCGEEPTPLPTVPVFPCAQSALAAHTQLSGPLLKHQTPTTLARLVGSKAWKSRHGVFCTNGPAALGNLASFTGVEPNAYALGTPISAGLGSIDLSSSITDEPLGTPGLGPSTLPGLGPAGLPTPSKPPLSAPASKGPASLPPPPRAKRAGSVSHVLIRGDETVRGREDEDGVRRPSLVPMLSLSFGRGDDLDRSQSELARLQHDPGSRVHSDLDSRVRSDLDEPQYARILPPMLAPPSSPLPVPPGPGASRSSLQLPGVGVHATGSALALPQPPVNIPLTNLPQPRPQHAAAFNLPSLSTGPVNALKSTAPALTTTSGFPPLAAPHPPTLARRPILPGSWPIAPDPHPAVTPSDLTETTPSAITPSDIYQSFSPNDSYHFPPNDAYGFSPYRASMASDFRVSVHSDAYQAVSPTSEMYLTANDALPSASTNGPGSYMNLVGSSSNLTLPVGSVSGSTSHLTTSHLAPSTSHLASASNLASSSHLDTNSHLDLSDTTPHASSTPFTTASDSSQASVYSVKLGLDAFRLGGLGSDTVRSGSDTFRSSASDVFRSNSSDVKQLGRLSFEREWSDGAFKSVACVWTRGVA
ncbi:hypothetical protein RSAG8_00366, partial [Rhizoctonia solani AG-8 WAC10335]